MKKSRFIDFFFNTVLYVKMQVWCFYVCSMPLFVSQLFSGYIVWYYENMNNQEWWKKKKRERILVYTCLWVKGLWVLCSVFCSAWKGKKLLLRILHEKQFSKLVSLIRCNLNWFKLSYMAFKDRNWDLFWLCIDSISLGLIAYHDRTQWQGGYFT